MIRKSGITAERQVIVMVPESTADITITELNTQLLVIEINFGLGFALMKSKLGMYFDSDKPRAGDYEKEVNCGASIGVVLVDENAEKWVGSYGGYLEDSDTGEIFGVTCAHNVCAHSIEGTDPKGLLELLPPGTSITQPAKLDRELTMSNLNESKKDHEGMLRRLQEKRDMGGSIPETRFTKLGRDITLLEKKIQKLTSVDDAFGVTTEMSELGVIRGELYDYVLLTLNPNRVGRNEIGGRFVRHLHVGTNVRNFGVDVHKHGRTTGTTSGILVGVLGDGKVERISEGFQCEYIHSGGGQLFSDKGDNGAWVREGEKAVGYIFGGGQTASINLQISWILSIESLCIRLKEKWGREFKILEG
jgi:hypothetical protein